jgi:hypothetical protein
MTATVRLSCSGFLAFQLAFETLQPFSTVRFSRTLVGLSHQLQTFIGSQPVLYWSWHDDLPNHSHCVWDKEHMQSFCYATDEESVLHGFSGGRNKPRRG